MYQWRWNKSWNEPHIEKRTTFYPPSHYLKVKWTTEAAAVAAGNRPTEAAGLTYLEDLREEARADLFAEEVVDARQAGHGASEGPVRRRAHPVGRVDAVERRLVQPVLWITEGTLCVEVHVARVPPAPQKTEDLLLVWTSPEGQRRGASHRHRVREDQNSSSDLWRRGSFTFEEQNKWRLGPGAGANLLRSSGPFMWAPGQPDGCSGLHGCLSPSSPQSKRPRMEIRPHKEPRVHMLLPENV